MPRFSANISTLYQEFPFRERIAQAAAHGFDAIEIQFPYTEDPVWLRAELEAHGLPLALINFPAGDLTEGGEGLAAVPGRESEFAKALALAREFAELLKPEAMNLLAGRPASQHDTQKCEEVFQSSLRAAFDITKDLDIRLVTEPINTEDMPGFFLHSSRHALDLIEAMPDVELFMQYDLYHMQVMEADIECRLPEVIEQVGHIQFSDYPGRTEPGLGILKFEKMFDLIDALGYSGYVGAEYYPTVATGNTLGWLSPYRGMP